jgi:Family of unknown function (DUF5302)
MTKSAKQGTAKAAAEQAETESSAATETTGVAEAQEQDNAEPATAEPATGDGASPDVDDMKRKFREALDRKKQFHSEGQGKGGHESGKVNGAHGPAASRRNFRRKSG